MHHINYSYNNGSLLMRLYSHTIEHFIYLFLFLFFLSFFFLLICNFFFDFWHFVCLFEKLYFIFVLILFLLFTFFFLIWHFVGFAIFLGFLVSFGKWQSVLNVCYRYGRFCFTYQYYAQCRIKYFDLWCYYTIVVLLPFYVACFVCNFSFFVVFL